MRSLPEIMHMNAVLDPVRKMSTETLRAELVRRGFVVTPDRGLEWVTLKELAKKAARTLASVSRTITRAGVRVPGLEIERANGGRGRIVRVRATAEFFTWLKSERSGAPRKAVLA